METPLRVCYELGHQRAKTAGVTKPNSQDGLALTPLCCSRESVPEHVSWSLDSGF